MSENYIERLFGSAKFQEQKEEFEQAIRKPDPSSGEIKDWRKRHSEAARAHEAVRSAIEHGLLIPDPCLIAGEDCRGKIHAHHLNGYDETHQLDVIWLCARHHGMARGKGILDKIRK